MLEIGKFFGSYKVIRLLGQGGMGSVYLLQNNRGQFAAAKILDPDAANDHESRARFLREAQIAQKIDTPSVVKTFDVGEDPSTNLCYILMEYVGGGSLHDVIRDRGTLTVEEALEYTRKIAEVLEEVRVYGVVHRDIKPDNIMFSNDGQIKLADLGIARSVSAKVTTITKSGVVMGTPAYMAPEQMIDSHSVDTRSDIYSLGIVLFEMIVGKRPHHDATFMELMAKAVQGEKIPDVRKFDSTVPAGVARLIAKMCHSNLSRRFSTPGEVVAAIEKLQGKKKKSKKAIRLRLKLKRNPFYFLIAGAVAAIAGGIIVFSCLLSSTDDNEGGESSDIEEKPAEEMKAPSVIESAPMLNAEGRDVPEYTAKNGQKIYSATFGGYKWYYRLNENGEAALCHYKQNTNEKIAAVEPNPTGEITVPAFLNGHKLVRLAGGAFRYVNATKIILPEGLKEVGSSAFDNCRNLKEMRFPDSVEKVESYNLFHWCSAMEEIDLNRAHGFGGDAILYIGRNLKKIKIDTRYSNLKYINQCVLSPNGKALYFAEPHEDGSKIIIPEGVEIISMFAFAGSSKNKSEIELPKSLNRLSDMALAWLNADVLVFPDGFEDVGHHSFWQAKIRTLVFPASIKNIFPDGFQYFGHDRIVFRGKIPPEFDKLCSKLDRKTTIVYGPKDVTGWAEYSNYPIRLYEGKDLAMIISGVDPEDKYLAYTTNDGQKVFRAEEKGLTFFYVLNQYGEAILHHPEKDNSDKRLTAIEPNPTGDVVIPSSLNGHTLVRLERDSLQHLKARHIELPNTIREISKGVFMECRNLESISLPNSVKNIDAFWLFMGCHNLRKLDLNKAQGFYLSAFYGIGSPTRIEIKINEAESDLKAVGNFLVRKANNRLVWVNVKDDVKRLIIPEEISNLEFDQEAFMNIDRGKTELIVNKSTKRWLDVQGFNIRFADFVSVAEWKSLSSYPQALRRAASRNKAKTKNGETANVFVGQLRGYDGDYRNVYSKAQISKTGMFFVAGEPGDIVEFSIKGYEKLEVALPEATLPQSGMIPVLSDLTLKKEGSR